MLQLNSALPSHAYRLTPLSVLLQAILSTEQLQAAVLQVMIFISPVIVKYLLFLNIFNLFTALF